MSKGTEDADSSEKKVSCEETSINEEAAPEENFEENISKQETSYSYPQIINTTTGEVYEITNSHFDIGRGKIAVETVKDANWMGGIPSGRAPRKLGTC